MKLFLIKIISILYAIQFSHAATSLTLTRSPSPSPSPSPESQIRSKSSTPPSSDISLEIPPNANSAPFENELSTGQNVNVTGHPNLYLLPNFTVCGNSYTGKPTRDKIFSSSDQDDKNEDETFLTRRKRVTAGLFTKLGKFPWMCRVYFFRESTRLIYFYCGCTIINDHYVITAAHCLTQNSKTGTPWMVSYGTVNRTSKFDCDIFGSRDRCSFRVNNFIEDIIIHPDYTTNSYNDVALVRLADPIVFTDFISPICLPRDQDFIKNWINNKLSVAGWGQTLEGTDSLENIVLPDLLRDLKIPLQPRKVCDAHYTRQVQKADESKLCAGGLPAAGDCKGDSGGPLMKKIKIPLNGSNNTQEQENWVQFGIISYGHCALEGVPGLYGNVLYYMPWILNTIEP